MNGFHTDITTHVRHYTDLVAWQAAWRPCYSEITLISGNELPVFLRIRNTLFINFNFIMALKYRTKSCHGKGKSLVFKFHRHVS